jgi:hypothetical protein
LTILPQKALMRLVQLHAFIEILWSWPSSEPMWKMGFILKRWIQFVFLFHSFPNHGRISGLVLLTWHQFLLYRQYFVSCVVTLGSDFKCGISGDNICRRRDGRAIAVFSRVIHGMFWFCWKRPFGIKQVYAYFLYVADTTI